MDRSVSSRLSEVWTLADWHDRPKGPGAWQVFQVALPRRLLGGESPLVIGSWKVSLVGLAEKN